MTQGACRNSPFSQEHEFEMAFGYMDHFYVKFFKQEVVNIEW